MRMIGKKGMDESDLKVKTANIKMAQKKPEHWGFSAWKDTWWIFSGNKLLSWNDCHLSFATYNSWNLLEYSVNPLENG